MVTHHQAKDAVSAPIHHLEKILIAVYPFAWWGRAKCRPIVAFPLLLSVNRTNSL